MQVAKLADFSLPPYVAPHSGAATASGEFATGMKAYRRGDCANAVAHLSRMSTGQDDEVTARFYAAACQLAAHDLAAATKNLWRVTGDIESPQYEAAHYYLAQLMLARGDVVAARQYLRRTADMQGDYASRARAELAKLQNLH
jgi:Tfp pilus assembly protein PilF